MSGEDTRKDGLERSFFPLALHVLVMKWAHSAVAPTGSPAASRTNDTISSGWPRGTRVARTSHSCLPSMLPVSLRLPTQLQHGSVIQPFAVQTLPGFWQLLLGRSFVFCFLWNRALPQGLVHNSLGMKCDLKGSFCLFWQCSGVRLGAEAAIPVKRRQLWSGWDTVVAKSREAAADRDRGV